MPASDPRSLPFSLATCSLGSGAPCAALVVADRVLPLPAAAEFVHREGVPLATGQSVLELLQQWERNFAGLQVLANAFGSGRNAELAGAALAIPEAARAMPGSADASGGGGLRSGSAPSDQLRFHPPVNLPRQIFCSGANYKKHVVQLFVAQTFHKN